MIVFFVIKQLLRPRIYTDGQSDTAFGNQSVQRIHLGDLLGNAAFDSQRSIARRSWIVSPTGARPIARISSTRLHEERRVHFGKGALELTQKMAFIGEVQNVGPPCPPRGVPPGAFRRWAGRVVQTFVQVSIRIEPIGYCLVRDVGNVHVDDDLVHLKSEIEEVFRLQVIYRWAVTAHPAFRTSRFGNADPNRPTNGSSYGTPTPSVNESPTNRTRLRSGRNGTSRLVASLMLIAFIIRSKGMAINGMRDPELARNKRGPKQRICVRPYDMHSKFDQKEQRRENRAVNRDYVRGAFRPSSDIVPVHSSDRRIATFILAFRRTGGVTSPGTPHGLLPRPKYHYAI
jgi:hypothetical protein